MTKVTTRKIETITGKELLYVVIEREGKVININVGLKTYNLVNELNAAGNNEEREKIVSRETKQVK